MGEEEERGAGKNRFFFKRNKKFKNKLDNGI